MRRYQPASVAGHEAEIRRLILAFLKQVSRDAGYHAGNVVHDCVVYIMAHKAATTPRVDGAAVQPLIIEVIEQVRLNNGPSVIFPRPHSQTPSPRGAARLQKPKRRWRHRIRDAVHQLLS